MGINVLQYIHEDFEFQHRVLYLNQFEYAISICLHKRPFTTQHKSKPVPIQKGRRCKDDEPG